MFENGNLKVGATYAQVVGRELASRREKANLDQAQMGQKLGLSQSSWSRIENGETVPDVDVLQKAAEVFGVKPSDILEKAESYQEKLEREGVVLGDKKLKNNDAVTLLGAAALTLLIAKLVSK